jgi:hypothetical protein
MISFSIIAMESDRTSMYYSVLSKPTSRLGVGVVKSIRFPEIKTTPGVLYNHATFVDEISKKRISFGKIPSPPRNKNMQPGPGFYYMNYAIGIFFLTKAVMSQTTTPFNLINLAG